MFHTVLRVVKGLSEKEEVCKLDSTSVFSAHMRRAYKERQITVVCVSQMLNYNQLSCCLSIFY